MTDLNCCEDYDTDIGRTLDYFGPEEGFAKVVTFIGCLAYALNDKRLEPGEDLIRRAVNLGINYPLLLSACQLTYEKERSTGEELFSLRLPIMDWKGNRKAAVLAGSIGLRLPKTIDGVPMRTAYRFNFLPVREDGAEEIIARDLSWTIWR